MKSREEVLKHLSETMYRKNDLLSIRGFLVGQGIIEPFEKINAEVLPEKIPTWKTFLNWYAEESEQEKKTDEMEEVDGVLLIID